MLANFSDHTVHIHRPETLLALPAFATTRAKEEVTMQTISANMPLATRPQLPARPACCFLGRRSVLTTSRSNCGTTRGTRQVVKAQEQKAGDDGVVKVSASDK